MRDRFLAVNRLKEPPLGLQKEKTSKKIDDYSTSHTRAARVARGMGDASELQREGMRDTGRCITMILALLLHAHPRRLTQPQLSRFRSLYPDPKRATEIEL